MTTTRTSLPFLLIASGTALSIAGTDLVLPAVPTLDRMVGGTIERAQLVLAAFTAGAALGLIGFGALGARSDPRRLLVVSLAGYALVSFACAFSPTLDVLIALRFLQGAISAAPAVFAPGILRALYGDDGAVKAIGLLGSIEALAPALAPIAGYALVAAYGWSATFQVIGGLAALLAAALFALGARLPKVEGRREGGSYLRLLRHGNFMRLALSHAFSLGAILVVVFGAPTVFVVTLGKTLTDFIVLQVCGIACFAVVANTAPRLVPRFGAERLMLVGNAVLALGAFALLLYALAGGTSIAVIIAFTATVNSAFGLRGPPGFHAAIVAAEDDARGAALVVVAILCTASLSTAAVAPFISHGLVALGTGATVLGGAALAILWLGRPRAPSSVR